MDESNCANHGDLNGSNRNVISHGQLRQARPNSASRGGGTVNDSVDFIFFG